MMKIAAAVLLMLMGAGTRVTDWGAFLDHGVPLTPDYEIVRSGGMTFRVDQLTGPAGHFDPARPECLIAQDDGTHRIKAHVVWSVNQFGTREAALWMERGGAVTQITALDVVSAPSAGFQEQQFLETVELLEAGDCVFVEVEHTALEEVTKRGKVKPGLPVGLNVGVPSFWMVVE